MNKGNNHLIIANSPIPRGQYLNLKNIIRGLWIN